MSDARLTALGDVPTPDAAVRQIRPADLANVLAGGWADFQAKPSHVILLALLYPVLGLLLSRAAAGYDLLPMIFPLISGFALIGPIAALGLYEISRRLERGQEVAWSDALNVFRSPSIGAMLKLSAALLVIYLVWIATAFAIYRLIFGAAPPASVGDFARDVLATPSGWALILIGCGLGLVYALIVLAVGSISFPMLLDRNVSVGAAVRASISAFRRNTATMLMWGLIIAAMLVVGSIPLFLGLVVVLPVLGHATWHLYRKLVP